jgi:pimeloyl-ACP methyl ester carboxylesterase
VNPVALHHEQHGPGDAPALLLAGSLGTTLAMWRPQVQALAQSFRIIALDHRGHGASPVPPAPYTIAEMGADVLADGRMAVVHGPTALSGTVVEAGDLRAGAALVLAGLVADGTTTVMGADLIERGYQHWAERLGTLGAVVRLKGE